MAVWMWAASASGAWGVELVLKDGRILRGKPVPLAGLSDSPLAGSPDGAPAKPIIMLDDDLRRTFVPILQVQEQRPEEAPVLERFRLRQKVLQGGLAVKSVGPLMQVERFDQFGRRRVKMNTARGPLDVIQAITEITPMWTKVQATNVVWDMRLATSSLSKEELAGIFARLAEQGGVEMRRRIARFYVQCERFAEAAQQVEAILRSAPEDPEFHKQMESVLQDIQQARARQLLAELKLRRGAGQHRLVQQGLKEFPLEGASGETRQEVREILREYEGLEAARQQVLKQFDALVAASQDEALRKRLTPIRAEIFSELSLETLGRMAAFREMLDRTDLSAEQKLALAISGWLLDSPGATRQLSTALSLMEVRSLVRRYFAASDQLTRASILQGLASQEAASPAMVARLLAHMKPAVETPPPAGGEALAYELEAAGHSGAGAVRYLVQLPPEYDPYRRYPAIVSLHGPGMTPEHQIDWWAGPLVRQGWRAGQASRHGYIVIAPAWAQPHQKTYNYSAREHDAVLSALRDACRRFSIDTDRVFLSGYSMGGDAAWDIGLAHPDLWAGVIPIAARSERYIMHYWENAALVPFYFVIGELDGDRVRNNARDWDRYMIRRWNVTVAEYLGRGHDGFSDEILRLFDWMGRCRRDFFPKQFAAVSMRPWDNFFWWVELADFPPKTMVDLNQRQPRQAVARLTIKAALKPTNAVYVQAGTGRVTIWLCPELLDLSKRIALTINGRRLTGQSTVLPDLAVLLEDAHARGDRQHPFWARIEWP
ncbi:MAG: alpha/beta hydrolase-fold protein [Thermoguttaceae bacterium]